MKATVITEGTEAGRFAATVASRGTFILGGGEKWRSPDSPSNYAEAMQGDTVTADGHVIKTANLSADLNHVSERLSYLSAVDAMANTGVQLARVRYVDLAGYGTVALGAAWPGLSDLEVRKMQASALSGDWRWREEYGAYDMAGSIFVNNPGLPLPARPVFAPVAMAASLSLPHPPITGYWVDQEETIMTMPGVTPSGGDLHIHVGNGAVAAPMTAAPAPAVEAAPEDMTPAAPADSVEGRVAALEARMDAVEAWLAEDAMQQMDAMPAALPEVPAPVE